MLIKNAINPKTVNKLTPLTKQFSTQINTFKEVRIPVPWGHLAGKWWGPRDKRPILAMHGWQDNCGTFDPLIPYLPKSLGILAVDFPGHGFSSPLPGGAFYHNIDYVILVKRIALMLNWPKVSLMGHSLGAIISYTYTMLYPGSVDFLICLENLKPLSFESSKRADNMAETIDSFIKYDDINNAKMEPPCYPLKVLEKKLHESTEKSIDLDACKYVLQRNVAPHPKDPNKFYISRDPRLKVLILLSIAQKVLVDNAHRLICPIFACKAENSPYPEKKGALEVMDIIKKVNKTFEFHTVEGTHHVHLNNPERLEGLINAFIKKYDTEDRSIGGLIPDLIKTVP